MAKLTAEMVIDLRDNTGKATQTVIGNLSRLRRAERDYDLAKMGMRLNREQRAHEDLIRARAMAQAQAEEEALARRRENYQVWASRGMMGALAVAGVATAAASAYKDYAEVERQVNRIVINAGKSADTINPTIGHLQQLAGATHQSFGSIVEGLETLIASGRELDDAMSFLPSVAMTAQASGAAISDIALSADALSTSLGVTSGEMQKAFDILVGGGKLGKFELKDMAQYLPSLTPAFAALGYKGNEGLMKLVATLQVMRSQTGSSAEAATLMSNVLNKIYTADTAKKFKDMGINLRKALDKARAEGRDVLDVFKQLAFQAVSGDLSKLPLLFTDAEMLKGMRALLSTGGMLNEMTAALSNVDGTALKDFNQIAADSAARVQDLQNAWDKFVLSVGAKLSDHVTPILERATTFLSEHEAIEQATKGQDMKTIDEDRADFIKRYEELNGPNKGYLGTGIGPNLEALEAYRQALIKKGRGGIDNILDYLKRDELVNKYIERGEQAASQKGPPKPTNGRAGYPFLGVRTGKIPVPIPRPDPSAPPEEVLQSPGRYPNRSYRDPNMRDYIIPYSPTQRYLLDRNGRAGEGRPSIWGNDLSRPSLPGAFGPQPVTVSGPITTQPSGVQKVEVTNLQRPNITLNLTVPVQQVMQDPYGAAQKFGRAVLDAISGAQADIGN